MAGNTVTLTFAGDAVMLQRAAKDAKESLDKVGRAAHDLDDEFGKAGDGIDGKSGRIRKKLDAFGNGLVESLQNASARLPGVLSNAVGSIPPQGQAIALALVGGLAVALAPLIGAAITSAVLLAVGGGALAVGIMSALKDPKVAKAFDGLRSKASKVFTEFGEPFKAPLIRAAKTFEGVLDSLRPSIDRIGKTIAPVIDKLAPALGEFFKSVMPGIEAAVVASTPLFDTLAQHLPAIGKALSDFFTQISEHGDDAAKFFGDLLTVLEWTIKTVGAVISWLTQYYSNTRDVLIGIKEAALAVGRWFRDTLWGKWIKGAWDAILHKAASVQSWLHGMPGRLKSAFAGIASALSSPFRSAFNRISDAWNNTIGRLSWSVPGWIPGIGGNSISVPNLPHFHQGGTVPGAPGSEMVAVLQAGETVTPARGGDGPMVHTVVQIDGDKLLDAITKGQRRLRFG
jgi:phage-related protein